MTEVREKTLMKAKLASQVHRYDDVIEIMRSTLESNVEVTMEEREILANAFKAVYVPKLEQWKTLISLLHEEESQKDVADHTALGVIKEYTLKIETELHCLLNQILILCNDHLIPSSQGEGKVFSLKM
jgi:14-3-3 protein epsilon